MVLVERLERAACRGLGKARIIETAAVLRPIERRKFHPAHFVGQILAGSDILHPHDAPIGAAILHRIEQMLAVFRRVPFGERGGAVLGPQIGVDQHPAFALQPLADIQHRLRLEPVVARIEIARPRLGRQAETLVIIQLGHPFLERVAAGQGGEIGVGDLVLRRDPIGHLRIDPDIILQPAIGIGDIDPELRIDRVAARGVGIGERRRRRRCRRGFGRVDCRGGHRKGNQRQRREQGFTGHGKAILIIRGTLSCADM